LAHSFAQRHWQQTKLCAGTGILGTFYFFNDSRKSDSMESHITNNHKITHHKIISQFCDFVGFCDLEPKSPTACRHFFTTIYHVMLNAMDVTILNEQQGQVNSRGADAPSMRPGVGRL
jgi:hypothetical protein